MLREDPKAWSFQLFLVLLMAIAASVETANAQRSGSTANQGPGAYSAADPYGANATLRDAMDAMQARNYPLAEKEFLEVLQTKPKEPRATLMLGVAEMMQGKWDQAKKHLETAVLASPSEPDPKSRLGVTLVKLGDLAGAEKQRADLAKLAADCKAQCANAKWINDDLGLLDQAIAAAKASPAAAPPAGSTTPPPAH